MNAKPWVAVVCASLLSVVGCFPSDVVWLPDSSGFLYVNADHALIQVQLKPFAERKIAVYEWLQPGGARPGLSADGERVALAALRCSEDTPDASLALVVLDRQGNVVFERELRWILPDADQDAVCEGAWIDWSADSNRLLISVGSKGVGVYALDSNEWLQWRDMELPLLPERLAAGVSLVVPDGSGFVAYEPQMDGPGRLVFVTWHGERATLEYDDVLRRRIEETGQGPLMFSDVWWTTEGSLRFYVGTQCVEVVPKQRRIAIVEDSRLQTFLARLPLTQGTVIPFDDQSVVVIRAADEPNRHTVELLRLGVEEAIPLVPSTRHAYVLRSPDAAKMILWYKNQETPPRYQFHVIDTEGKTLAKMLHFVEE